MYEKEKKILERTINLIKFKAISRRIPEEFPEGSRSMGWVLVFGDIRGATRGSNVVAESSQTMEQSRLGNFGERVSRQSHHYDVEERLPL